MCNNTNEIQELFKKLNCTKYLMEVVVSKLVIASQPEQTQKRQKPVLVKRSFKKNIITVNLVNGTTRSNIGNGKTTGFHSSPKF